MDGLLKVPVDVDLLAQLHKDAGHARVLTDGQIPLPGVQLILLEQLQGLLGQGPGLPKQASSMVSVTSSGRTVLARMQSRATAAVIAAAGIFLMAQLPLYYLIRLILPQGGGTFN